MHVSHKKSSGWEPSYFQHWASCPPTIGAGRKGKKKENSLTATISCGSFLALSLLPPSATCSQSLHLPLKEPGMSGEKQGGPDCGMFLILCALPPARAPSLLFLISAPSRAILKGCHGVMSNRSCFRRLTSCLLFPPNLTAKRAILCLACANPDCSR